jgi:uncharacterized membrane protein YdjX (TVP38/TMEM64 family)
MLSPGGRTCLVASIGLAPLVLLLTLGAIYRGELVHLVVRFAEWLQLQGRAGQVVYTLAFAAAIVLCGPSTPLELVGGFCYPFWIALLLNGLGKWAGSVLSFQIGRHFAAAARRYLGGGGGAEPVGGRMLGLVNDMLRTHQTKALLLARFAYAPMPLKNYGLGAFTTVSLRPFALTCVAGDLAATVMLAYAGQTVKSLVDVLEGREPLAASSAALAVASCLATIALTLLLTRYARRALDGAPAIYAALPQEPEDLEMEELPEGGWTSPEVHAALAWVTSKY